MYGPSAATGLVAAGGIAAFTDGNVLFAFLAGFTLFSAALALGRITPKIKRGRGISAS